MEPDTREEFELINRMVLQMLGDTPNVNQAMAIRRVLETLFAQSDKITKLEQKVATLEEKLARLQMDVRTATPSRR